MTAVDPQLTQLVASGGAFVPNDAAPAQIAASRAVLAAADRAADSCGHGRRCRDLWQAMLTVLWLDSFTPEGPNRDANRDAEAARRWFGSRDFGEVCWLAGFDPAPVYESWLRQQADWRAAGSPRQSGNRQSRRVRHAEARA